MSLNIHKQYIIIEKEKNTPNPSPTTTCTNIKKDNGDRKQYKYDRYIVWPTCLKGHDNGLCVH